MQHDAMEDCFLKAETNSNWSEQDKEEILNKAAGNYLKKKRKTKIADATKKSVLASHISQLEISDSSSVFSSSNECSNMEDYSE